MSNPALSNNPALNGKTLTADELRRIYDQPAASLQRPGVDQPASPPVAGGAQLPPVVGSDKPMTYENTISKTVMLFIVVLATAAVGWFVPILMIPGALVGLVLGLVNAFKKEPNVALIVGYAAAQGLFLGGISGVMMGTEQLNMLIHNTIYVPGHFHATVVVGTTLSFMALTYFLIPVLFRREMINPGLAKAQPYLFGLSMYFFCLVMMGAGTLGVSRRHWDMAFSGAAQAYEWPGAAYLMMGLVGIAGIAAILGGAIYIYITVGSLLWGKKLDTGAVSAKFTPIPPTAPTIVAQSYGSAGFAAPGTFVMAMVFGHAPIIFPAVLRVAVPYHPAFYLPLLLLHAGLVLRLGGDALGDFTIVRAGGMLGAVALAAFIVGTVSAVVRGLRQRRFAPASSAPSRR